MQKYIFLYLIIINIISGIIFYTDKQKAKKRKNRISEKNLHILEFFGGAFSIFFLMYIIRHKNKKIKYWIFTYLSILIWTIFLVYIFVLIFKP